MRERAELMGGTISFSAPARGGTLMQLSVPRDRVELEPEISIAAVRDESQDEFQNKSK
jgi:hypothetical protein